MMDWEALRLSVELAAVTLLVLLPMGLALARWLARTGFQGKAWIEALVVLPLVLPPTVLGYYLLVTFGAGSPLGAWVLFQIVSVLWFADDFVAWWAHVGGLVAGALLVLVLRRPGVALFDRDLPAE